jgi:alanyl-tRNA synthetase
MTQSKTWTSSEVREKFLSYFESKGHKRVPSSSLVPAEDPTLLFTNAGMNQFKDLFLGRETREYKRATTVQKCVRAGGKHNDLDNVGYTARHHTFFEMLGNFSFGDYFKKDAIEFAWELVTHPKWYGLDSSRLWATVYLDDDEAATLWERHLPKERILRFGEKDNFWSMGDTGPCGPCSELHYDQGPDVPGDDRPNGKGDRVIEIWNLVFMQYDRDASGRTTPLPKPSVDTGAGLERITALLEGKNNNYDTDLFAPLITRIEEISGRSYVGGMAVEDAPFRVIADHARATLMLMSETPPVIPGSEGRGYVLRRIIRRAQRYGRRLGIVEPFLTDVVDLARTSLALYFDSYSATQHELLLFRLREEEKSFLRTMSEGADRVGEAISSLRRSGETLLVGDTVFRFYDTYGIPLDLIQELALDEGVLVDRDGFEKEMAAARDRSRAGSKFEAGDSAIPESVVNRSWETKFVGYAEDAFVKLDSATVTSTLRVGKDMESGFEEMDLDAPCEGWVILDKTVFYPEGGGQVSDVGFISWPGGEAEVLEARWSHDKKTIQHRVRVTSGKLQPGGEVSLQVAEWARRKTQANHTGTHLLHAALRKVLGETVRQMGSLVAPDRLRFDYAAPRAMTKDELATIERLVNEEVLRDVPVSKAVMSMEEAKATGAMMFFGEKYGERVRVVDVPGFSTELCGGCHVARTGEIGAFKVVSDRGLAAGVRRIEAVTALGAVERFSRDEAILGELSEVLQVAPDELGEKARDLSHRLRENEKEIARLKVQLAASGGGAAESRGEGDVEEVGGVKVLVRQVPSLPMNELRNLADTFRGKLKSGVVLIGTEHEGKVTLLAAVTPDLTGRVSAHELAQAMAPVVGGKGGGKPDLAQAGGKDAARIGEALQAGLSKARERLVPAGR